MIVLSTNPFWHPNTTVNLMCDVSNFHLYRMSCINAW